jgi:asparagine synthase (glutamine-hydrolysing)
MCGFTITKEPVENKIKHRGLINYITEFNGWIISFDSLPLSSNKTGLIQPLECNDKLIVFNGEIFNHQELMPSSQSDLHYLKNQFIKLKTDPVSLYKESLKWDGFWSISIICKNGDVFSFTDPLGKKQLYYNKIGISSEIKGVLQEYEYRSYSEKNFGTLNTNFTTVDRYLPGKLYLYKKGNIRPFLLMSIDYLKIENNLDLYQLIDRSVKRRLQNKIDGISLLLSSGLDSNIVLHHVLKYSKEIDLVSIENEESEAVDKICKEYGISCNFISDKFSSKELNDAIYFYEYSLDYGSLMPQYLLFKNANNSIVLTGDGADELFGGYSRAKEKDTWQYDVFNELPFYHNIRLDRMSMAFTKEARSPLMSIDLVRYANSLQRINRIDKKILRDTYRNILPEHVINGKKKPLRYLNDKQFNLNLINTKHQEIWQCQKKK